MGEKRGMKALELWCRRVTEGYPGVKIDNMTTSWRDGLAFCALIHHFRPDLIDFDRLDKRDILKNNELAFRVAERQLGIPALLDAEDMLEYEIPDRLSILTYLSQFYQAFAQQGGTSPSVRKHNTSVSEILTPSPTNPTVKVGRGRVERCSACERPVFLAERLVVGGKLRHRSCFSCARCGHQLNPVSSYETETGDFVCEMCPDEDKKSGNPVQGLAETDAPLPANEKHHQPDSQPLEDGRTPTDPPLTADAIPAKPPDPSKSKFLSDILDGNKTDLCTEVNVNDRSDLNDDRNPSLNSSVNECVDASHHLDNTNLSMDNDKLEEDIVESYDKDLAQNEHKIDNSGLDKREQLASTDISMEVDSAIVETFMAPEVSQNSEEEIVVAAELDAVSPEVSESNEPEIKDKSCEMMESTDSKENQLDANDLAERLKSVDVTIDSNEVDLVEVEVENSEEVRVEHSEEVRAEDSEEVRAEDSEDVRAKEARVESNEEVNKAEQEEPSKLEESVLESSVSNETTITITDTEDSKNYPSSLNPFGDDSEEEEGETKKAIPVPSTRSCRKVEVNVEGKTIVEAPKNLNPFWSESDLSDEENDSAKPKPAPRTLRTPEPIPRTRFGSSTSLTSQSSSAGKRKKRPAPQPPSSTESLLRRPPSPVSSLSSPSSYSSRSPATTRRRKSRPAPPPPINFDKERKDYENKVKQNLSPPDKSTFGKWKRKKGAAPGLPIPPQRRRIIALPVGDVNQEVEDLEVQQAELERQGVRVEQAIRRVEEGGEPETSSAGEKDIEEMVLQLFEIVNQKNELFRRQAELMFLRKQQRLEEEHADIEYQIRCLMGRPKNEADPALEEELIRRLVDVVERRNEIIDCLDMNRRRAVEEDQSIHDRLQAFTARENPEPSEEDTTPVKKSSKSVLKLIKKKKEKKKEKEEVEKKNDLDVDIDESLQEEQSETKPANKPKKKWFKLEK